MVTLLRLVHPQNASLPILVTGNPSTVAGITILEAEPLPPVIVTVPSAFTS